MSWLPTDAWNPGRLAGVRLTLGQLIAQVELRKLGHPVLRLMLDTGRWPLLSLDLLWVGVLVARE